MQPAADPGQWSRLSQQLDVLLDLPVGERAAWLDALRTDDAEAAESLARLLAQADSTGVGRFMNGQALDAEAPTLAGQQLGAYTLTAPLGQGGGGTVWRGRRHDGRYSGEVAVKLLHLSLLGRAAAERFQREGEILARLTHPHIARLLDAGVAIGGQPYLVLELVEGEPIDDYCRKRHLDVPARLALFDGVLAAVTHAHQHLVIHRDIKPANILVTPEGTVKLLDFGIAKLAEPDTHSAEATQLTRDAGRVLTPRYAAPEQLRGDTITTATDVYGLGLLLYQLLAERLPERPATAAIDYSPPPPSRFAIEPARQRVLRGDLDTIVLRAMKPVSAERYPSVSALHDDLIRYRDGRTVLARPDSWAYRARKFVLRHKAGTAIVAAVALALLGGAYAQVAVLFALAAGAAAALWQAAAARREAAAARAAQARAEEVKQFIASIFTEAKPRDGVGGVVTAADLLNSATDRIEAELGANPAVAGELGVLVAQSCSELGELRIGNRAAQAAWPRCEEAFGPQHPLALQARYFMAEAANNIGRHEFAIEATNALAADLRNALPAQASLLLSSLCGLSFALAKFERKQESFAALQEAVAVGEQHLGPLHDETIRALGLLSNTHMHFGENDHALTVGEITVQRARQVYGAQRPHTGLVGSERWYAAALNKRGRPADAEPLARQVVVDQHLLDGGMSLRVVQAMTVHSQALAALGRTHAAVELSRQVVDEHARLFPGDHRDNAIFAERLALQLMATRRASDIEEWLAREAAIWAAVKSETEMSRFRRERVLANVAAWRGDGAAVLAGVNAVRANSALSLALERASAERIWAAHCRWQARPRDAASAAQQAIEAMRSDAFTDADRAAATTELALAWLDAGDQVAASGAVRDALQMFELAQVEPSLLRADHDVALGRLHLLDGDAAAAAQVLARAERNWREENPDSIWHAEAAHWLARALRTAGNSADADALDSWVRGVLAAAPLPSMRLLVA
jgi:serine/threonine-protein kinase